MKARIYVYGGLYKVVWFHHGFPEGRVSIDEQQRNDCKLDNNISRARGRVLELALCNPWEWFCTLTLDGSKQDRSDIDGFVKDLGVWVGNFNRKYGCKLRYLLIPELHKDGQNWHMHGLLHGLPDSAVQLNEHGYYDLPYYRGRFGFISLSRVRDHERVSRYITKYISKAMCDQKDRVQKHMFYSSRGLEGKELLVETDLPVAAGAYVGDYTSSLWVSGDDELSKVLVSEGKGTF